MNLPDALSDRFTFFNAFEEDWQPVATWALAA